MKKTLSIFLILILFLTLGISCNKDNDPCMENIDPNCACTMVYQPVCGCNGKTYGNACEAQCAGIEDFSTGECK